MYSLIFLFWLSGDGPNAYRRKEIIDAQTPSLAVKEFNRRYPNAERTTIRLFG